MGDFKPAPPFTCSSLTSCRPLEPVRAVFAFSPSHLFASTGMSNEEWTHSDGKRGLSVPFARVVFSGEFILSSQLIWELKIRILDNEEAARSGERTQREAGDLKKSEELPPFQKAERQPISIERRALCKEGGVKTTRQEKYEEGQSKSEGRDYFVEENLVTGGARKRSEVLLLPPEKAGKATNRP